LTFRLIKGPIDLTSIQLGTEIGEYNATIISNNSTKNETITSENGLIKRCFLQVVSIKLEFINIKTSSDIQHVQINLTTCERTLRKFYFKEKTKANSSNIFFSL
jgi:hypothetical protein